MLELETATEQVEALIQSKGGEVVAMTHSTPQRVERTSVVLAEIPRGPLYRQWVVWTVHRDGRMGMAFNGSYFLHRTERDIAENRHVPRAAWDEYETRANKIV